MSLPNEQQGLNTFLAAIQPVLIEAYNTGFKDGLVAGEQIGFVAGINALTPAVSDGLRHGSPECGRAMQGLKNMGVNSENNA